jgi:hypothetical protein
MTGVLAFFATFALDTNTPTSDAEDYETGDRVGGHRYARDLPRQGLTSRPRGWDCWRCTATPRCSSCFNVIWNLDCIPISLPPPRP